MDKKKPLIKRLNELAGGAQNAPSDAETESGDSPEIDELAALYASDRGTDGESTQDEISALDVLYGDRPDILEAATKNDAEDDASDTELIDAEKVEKETGGEGDADNAAVKAPVGAGAGEIAEINSETPSVNGAPAVAVRRIRENNKLKINKFDAFFIKLWSLIVAIVVGMANGINWVVQGIFKKRLPDKYVRAFVAATIVILLIVLFTVPFSIEIKTDEQIEIFSDGLLPVAEKVYINNNPEVRWGYMNKNGKTVIEARYIEALPFTHGVAWVRTASYDANGYEIEDYWSLINKKGKSVGKDTLKFDHDTRAVGMERPVGEFPKDVKLAWVYIAGKYGFIKSNGTYAITPRYELVEDYCNGLARVRMGSMEYYINQKGNQVGNTFNRVKSFSEGLGAVMMNDIWGFVNTKGDMVIDPQYNDVSSFKGGYAAVRNGEAYGIIDAKGRAVVEPIRYVDLVSLSKNFAELIDSIRLDK